MTAACKFFILALIAATSGTRVRRDIGGVCQEMWDVAQNNMKVDGTEITVDTSAKPAAGAQLFTVSGTGVNKLATNVYKTFKAVLDNYLPGSALTAIQKALNEETFINTIAVPGGPVDKAYQYLLKNGKTAAKDLNTFKPVLKTMWFAKYGKKKSADIYSGFEHTFVGEVDQKKKNVVKGLHNWYQFYIEQAAGRLTLEEPDKTVLKTDKQPPLINVKFTWNNKDTKVSSFYVGTSPAFEVALYTACFFGEPGECTCTIGKKQLKVKTFDYQNSGKVLTAFPPI